MKKLILLPVVLLGLLFTACNPMEKIDKDLKQIAKPIAKKSEYTLTKDDYSKLATIYVKDKLASLNLQGEDKKKAEQKLKKEASSLTSLQAFNQDATAKSLIPKLLAGLYPEWGQGSSVLVHYNNTLPRSKYLNDVWSTAHVTLTEDVLKAAGINSIPKLTKEQEAKVLELAKAADKKAKNHFVKLVIAKKSFNVVFIDGKIATHKDFKNVYLPLQYEDYKAMNLKYPNFSSSASPQEYLDIYLNQNYAYGNKEGYHKVVMYIWYESKEKPENVRSIDYVYSEGRWVVAGKVKTEQDQFLHNGKGWLFDPTIEFKLEASDFVTLYNDVKENHPNYISKRYKDNEEFWYCGSSYYKNFNLDGGETQGERAEEKGLDKDKLVAMREKRIIEGLQLILATRYPNAPAMVDGVEQFYVIHTVIRLNSSNEDRTFRFKGLGDNKYEYLPNKK